MLLLAFKNTGSLAICTWTEKVICPAIMQGSKLLVNLGNLIHFYYQI